MSVGPVEPATMENRTVVQFDKEWLETLGIVKIDRPASLPLEIHDERATFAPMAEEQRLTAAFAATGVTAGMSLVEVRRDAFTRAGCLSLIELRQMRVGAKVKVGGLIADGVRRPPTAKGTAFIQLERDGMIDVIIPQKVYLDYREALRSAFVVVEGVLKANGMTVSVVARRIEALQRTPLFSSNTHFQKAYEFSTKLFRKPNLQGKSD